MPRRCLRKPTSRATAPSSAVLTHIIIWLFACPASWAQQNGVDPTENVKALVTLEAKRLDELRMASDKFNAAAIAAARDQFNSEIAHINASVMLRADYDEKLRTIEKGRIDAIRLVDQNNVAVASQKSDQQATTLAKQVSDVAEALRKSASDSADKLATLVTSTAATERINQQQQFAALGTQVSALSTRITTLEQSGVGLTGRGEGINMTMTIIATVAGLVIGLLAIGIPILVKRNNGRNGYGYDRSGVPRGG